MNLNKVFVLGNLTRDPERRSLPSGQPVVSFGLATNRFFTDQDGQKREETEFHNIVVFGRLAEIASQHLKKGSMVLIEGRIKTRSWQDAGGIKRYRTEVIAERMQLGPRINIGQRDAVVQTTAQPQEPMVSFSKTLSDEDIPVIEEPIEFQPKKNSEPSKKQPNYPAPENFVDDEEEIDLNEIPF